MDREISHGEQLTLSYQRYRQALQAGIIDHPSLGIDKSYTERLRVSEREYLAYLHDFLRGPAGGMNHG